MVERITITIVSNKNAIDAKRKWLVIHFLRFDILVDKFSQDPLFFVEYALNIIKNLWFELKLNI